MRPLCSAQCPARCGSAAQHQLTQLFSDPSTFCNSQPQQLEHPWFPKPVSLFQQTIPNIQSEAVGCMVVSYYLRLGGFAKQSLSKGAQCPALACLFPQTLARSGLQPEYIHAPVPAHTRAPVSQPTSQNQNQSSTSRTVGLSKVWCPAEPRVAVGLAFTVPDADCTAAAFAPPRFAHRTRRE